MRQAKVLIRNTRLGAGFTIPVMCLFRASGRLRDVRSEVDLAMLDSSVLCQWRCRCLLALPSTVLRISGEDAELQDAPSYSASLGSLVMCDVCITKCRSSNFSTRLRSRPWRSTANHPKLFAALEYMSGPIVQHPHAATVLSEVRALQS